MSAQSAAYAKPYLILAGQAKEALEFYAKCLDAEVSLITMGTFLPDCPPESKDRIMHGCVMYAGEEESLIMASDASPGQQPASGNNWSVMLVAADVSYIEKAFAQLSEGAEKINTPLAETAWAQKYGMITDKFGVQWMINGGMKNKCKKNSKHPYTEVYLTFDGQAKEAMEFYHEAFGCDLDLKTQGQCVPDASAQSKNQVWHSCLSVGDNTIVMACDLLEKISPGMTIKKATNFFVSVHSKDVEQMEKWFNAMSVGGSVGEPFAETAWAVKYGFILDKFGIHWMFNVSK